jgi:autotransporter translocation and assembly factor TamB
MKNFIYAMMTSAVIIITFSSPAAKADQRTVSSFDQLDLKGAFTITLIQGSTETVNIDAPSETASKIFTKVEEGVLSIYTEKDFNSENKISITVNFKNLKSIDCSGANVINATAPLKFNDFSFDASGACKANLEFTSAMLDIDMSGAVNATFKGTAKQVKLDISGAGKLLASDLKAESYDIDISGTGNAEVNASSFLNVEVSGTGNVKYKGDPKITKEVSGTGNVTRMQ